MTRPEDQMLTNTGKLPFSMAGRFRHIEQMWIRLSLELSRDFRTREGLFLYPI